MTKKFVVSSSCGLTSEPLESHDKAERWVTENLDYGIQKCRTGDYIILEGIVCGECGEFNEVTDDLQRAIAHIQNESRSMTKDECQIMNRFWQSQWAGVAPHMPPELWKELVENLKLAKTITTGAENGQISDCLLKIEKWEKHEH